MIMNKTLILTSFCFFFLCNLCHQRVHSSSELGHASTPPRGWNSYDSFCWTVSEQEFIKNAEIVATRLHSSGYEYAVVDYLWYRRKVHGAWVDSLGYDVIDEWGRLIPAPDRWPSSMGGKGFSEVANKVHGLGLKFGIHVMRGISTQAYNKNTPILDTTTGRAYVEAGRTWHAKDIGLKERSCGWMKNGFMSVNTTLGAGRAFLRSLYEQYASWGVDFVKHDCVFGDDFSLDEISYVSEILKEQDNPILYSLSPGTSATPAMAREVSSLVNMYRVTGDDWDYWSHVAAHFDVSRATPMVGVSERDFSEADMIGGNGLLGNSWPDLDMLPLGWLTDPGVNHGPNRKSRLTLDEQKTQMTLWSIAKSPLMFGGDLRNLDDATFNLITNPTLMEINSFSSNNREFPYISAAKDVRIQNRGLNFQSRSLNYARETETYLGLINCKDSKAKGWSTKILDDDLEQICWKGQSGGEAESPFCLYKRESLLETDEQTKYIQQYEEKHHLLASLAVEYCLDASPTQRLTANSSSRGSFSPCKWHSSQMWELTDNGTLINEYSGLCASVTAAEDNGGISEGIRSWIATGRKGETYVAFFNLNSERTKISTTIPDLTKALPGKNISSCSSNEVWRGQNVGIVSESLSVFVEPHGCALFVLNCT